MQIDIPAHIEKLLFLHDALIIPGFGGFTATRTPATTDYVGGSVTPPAKTLAFSENLTVDDGVLVGDVAQTHGISMEDARKTIAEFVEKIQNLLNQREIVTLPGVGRLYRNYVQKIQFLPDSTNFNASSYGLPPLQFSPIARSREVTDKPAAESPAATTSVAPETPYIQPAETFTPSVRGGRSRVGLALGIIFLFASLAIGIWYWQQRKKQALIAERDRTEQTDAPAVKETRSEKPATTEKKTEHKNVEQSAQDAANEKMAAAREQVAKTAEGRECILVIATLREKNNADRLMQILRNDGHEVYFLEKNGYQIGVKFKYTKVSEIQETINILTKLTGEDQIWIKKK
jgi:cell division septation protein DedD